MVVSALLVGLIALWALLLTRRAMRLVRTAEWLVVAGGLALAASCWLPFLAARAVGLEKSIWLAPAVAAGLVAWEWGLAPRALRQSVRRGGLFVRRGARRGYRLVAAGFALAVAFHAWGHVRHCLHERADGGYWTAGAAWEDQAFHGALATSFALGDNLTRLSYPHLPEWPLGYPFLADFQAGWFFAAGMSLPAAFAWGNTLASAVFLAAALTILRRWLGSGRRALLALVLWHLGGGFGLAALWPEVERLGSWRAAWLAHDYANDWALGLHFHNFTTAIVWPMRVAWYGLAVALTVVVGLTGLLRRGGGGAATSAVGAVGAARGGDVKGVWGRAGAVGRGNVGGFALMGALAGALGLVGAHGLVVLACVVAPMAWASGLLRRWKVWGAAVAVGACVVLPQMVWMKQQLARSEPAFVRWHLGWMAEIHGKTGAQAWSAWATHGAWNTGAWIAVGLVGWFLAGRALKRETVGWWAILALGQAVVFQPFVFDNIKLFAAGALAAAAGLAWLLARWWAAGAGGKLAVVAMFPVFTASGVQSIISEMAQPSLIADRGARRFAELVVEKTPRGALILTGPQLHHPVLVLAGRRVVAANVSGMTLHGVPNMPARIEEAARIYRGEARAGSGAETANGTETRAALERLGVDWIVVGPMERIEYGGDVYARVEAWATLVAEAEGGWRLYSVKK